MFRRFKDIGKAFICLLLEKQARRLKRRNDFKIICVAGSVGKTSTKLAVAQLLSATATVQYQDGNYNDRLTVPLVIFGHREPHIFNVFAWLRILATNEQLLRREYPYQYIVLEVGTDKPGQIKQFAYLQPDITIVTSIAPEHMEYFKTIEAVAVEELEVFTFSKQTFLNIDDIDAAYIPEQPYRSYGKKEAADYRLVKRQDKPKLQGQTLTIVSNGQQSHLEISLLGEQGAKICLAAIAVAKELDFTEAEIQQGAATLAATAGRMKVLHGKQSAILLDDTYNASPLAVKAALDVLYASVAPQRIAILGSMNEMGELSPELHADVGRYCDPAKLDLVLTIGQEANAYLAPVAQEAGCTVVMFDHPRLAGEYAKQRLQPGAVVLAKGSQNGVFAEEALVPLLNNSADTSKLVRQSPYWQALKKAKLAPLDS